MATDIFRSALIITQLPSMFALAVHNDVWKAVCLRCGSVVVENGDLSEINRAEELHHCELKQFRVQGISAGGRSG